MKRYVDRRYANKISQVVTLTDVWLFLPFPLFCFVLEEREVPSPQRSKWYFRLRSSWECGWARTWLHWAVEDWRCSDGSALWRRPGWICYSTWRPPDASSQRYYIYSGCSHSWGLVNSFSAAAFCRWDSILSKQFTFISAVRSSDCCLHLNAVCLRSLFSVTAFTFYLSGQNKVWTHILKSWPHLPTHNILCWLQENQSLMLPKTWGISPLLSAQFLNINIQWVFYWQQFTEVSKMESCYTRSCVRSGFVALIKDVKL